MCLTRFGYYCTCTSVASVAVLTFRRRPSYHVLHVDPISLIEQVIMFLSRMHVHVFNSRRHGTFSYLSPLISQEMYSIRGYTITYNIVHVCNLHLVTLRYTDKYVYD